LRYIYLYIYLLTITVIHCTGRARPRDASRILPPNRSHHHEHKSIKEAPIATCDITPNYSAYSTITGISTDPMVDMLCGPPCNGRLCSPVGFCLDLDFELSLAGVAMLIFDVIAHFTVVQKVYIILNSRQVSLIAPSNLG